jgi:energy-coupling factor transporter ATP-binding protein EcfA2
MSEIETICPYTGLRSFTEEESLYFKGRDEQILRVTAQLEEKKFLMVTGASGDGKSSLIFAGLIPQARAGFFKAQYSNWHVADFRPERSPLKNLARSLAGALQLDDPNTVEVELSRGFSSLVELYKSSDRYIDEKSETWQRASEDAKGKMERKAGNLLILIDQFEEFFTNPENFPGGVPSQESRLLLNIILETIKISLKEDLPIYVVCTMRSDYIGQCAAFRGLPEFIGFSQFFVPRLQRKELHQVIEEPAILSGNRISKRLIDRLIFDLEEGTDQLPILQHALKQIWKAANNGQEEMDLIHYAIVGGMSGDVLPKELTERFAIWKEKLPEYERAGLENPGLSNVLDIHANKLYEEAASYYNKHSQKQITAKQARFIIAMSFACLTRIDESRAVRNRMTLQEITNIINVPELTTDVVDGVLRIFREPENTLLRPFIAEENTRESIEPDTVIDITHEALIRNWKLLRKWSDQEYDYYVTFLDFRKQVDRWIEHGKSADFLLPIGPLTYFENWYKNCRPNQYWINRYTTDDAPPAEKLQKSYSVLKNCRDYLRKSALRLMITRSFMKYGAGRIASVAGILVLLLLSGFYLYSAQVRKNESIIRKILREGEVLLQDKELISFDHAFFLASAERLSPGYFEQMLRVLPEQKRIDVTANFLIAFLQTEPRNPPPILRQSIVWLDSLVMAEGTSLDSANMVAVNQHLLNLNALVRNLSYYYFFNRDESIANKRNQNVRNQADLVRKIVSGPRQAAVVDMKAWHIALTDVMNYKGFGADERKSLIEQLSPFESNETATLKFNAWFPVGEKIVTGINQNFSHNGGYQSLAYLYASVGNVRGALQCLDNLRRFNRNYDRTSTNSTHVGIYFLMYGHHDAFRQFVHTYAQQLGILPQRYVGFMLDKSGIITREVIVKFIKGGNFNDNFVFLPDSISKELFNFSRTFIQVDRRAPDEINFELALLYKQEGIFEVIKNRREGIEGGQRSDSLFKAAFHYYGRVSPSFLNAPVGVQSQTFFTNVERITILRNHLFLYPEHFRSVEPFMAVSETNYYNDSFFHFLLSNNLFSTHYKRQEDYQLIVNWISTYFSFYRTNMGRSELNYPDPGRATFLKIDSLVSHSGYAIDNAWVKLALILDYFGAGDTVNAYRHAESLKLRAIERPSGEDALAFRSMVFQMASEMAVRGKRSEAFELLRNFNNRKNRLKAYAKVAALCYRQEEFTEAAIFLDSANDELARLKNFAYNAGDFREPLVEVLTLQNSRESRKKALEYIGSMQGFSRASGIFIMAGTYARLGEYYEAMHVMPAYASYYDKVVVYYTILEMESLRRGNTPDEWKSYAKVVLNTDFVTFQNDLLPD